MRPGISTRLMGVLLASLRWLGGAPSQKAESKNERGYGGGNKHAKSSFKQNKWRGL